jgi:hypothetical protein
LTAQCPPERRGPPASSRGDARPKRRRDTVSEMDTFEALRERVLYPFEALGPIERKDVDLVPLFRAASS